MERSRTVTFKGQPLTLVGKPLSVGDSMPICRSHKSDGAVPPGWTTSSHFRTPRACRLPMPMACIFKSAG